MKDTENIGIENIDIETAIDLKANIDRTLTSIETINFGIQILTDDAKQKNRKLEELSKSGQSDIDLKTSVNTILTAINAINAGIRILLDEVSKNNSKLEKLFTNGQSEIATNVNSLKTKKS